MERKLSDLHEKLGIFPIFPLPDAAKLKTDPIPVYDTSADVKPENFPASVHPNVYPVGLQNMGNTCWANSATQILCSIPTLRRVVLEILPPLENESVILSLQKLFIILAYSRETYYVPLVEVQELTKLLGTGQQDMAELIGVLLTRISLTDNKSTSLLSISMSEAREPDFIQYNLPINKRQTLEEAIRTSLVGALPKSRTTSPGRRSAPRTSDSSRHWFHVLPPVFLVDLFRLSCTSRTGLEKHNHQLEFPPILFMDKYIAENRVEVLREEDRLKKLRADEHIYSSEMETYCEILQTYSRVETDPESCEELEQTIREKTVELQQKIAATKENIRLMENTHQFYRRPYRLHAVAIHSGQPDSGHYYVFVWRNAEWYCADDDHVSQVAWDEVVENGFGRDFESNTSASCLVYLDATKMDVLFDGDVKQVNPTLAAFIRQKMDVLCTDSSNQNKRRQKESKVTYLREPTSPQFFSTGLVVEQTAAAIQQLLPSSTSFYDALDLERDRLYSLHNTRTEDVRWKHLVLYMLANGVKYYPLIHWALLQHFAAPAIVFHSAQCSGMQSAASEALAHLESCVLEAENEEMFVWHRAFQDFCEICALFVHAIDLMKDDCYIAAMDVYMELILRNRRLRERSLLGPDVGFDNQLIDQFITKSAQVLKDELNSSVDRDAADLAELYLFEPLATWAAYRNDPAVWSTARDILDASFHTTSSKSVAKDVVTQRNGSFPPDRFHSPSRRVFCNIQTCIDKLSDLSDMIAEARSLFHINVM